MGKENQIEYNLKEKLWMASALFSGKRTFSWMNSNFFDLKPNAFHFIKSQWESKINAFVAKSSRIQIRYTLLAVSHVSTWTHTEKFTAHSYFCQTFKIYLSHANFPQPDISETGPWPVDNEVWTTKIPLKWKTPKRSAQEWKEHVTTKLLFSFVS